jgi:hypothetical protein
MNFFRDTERTFFLPTRMVRHWLVRIECLRGGYRVLPNFFKAVRYVIVCFQFNCTLSFSFTYSHPLPYVRSLAFSCYIFIFLKILQVHFSTSLTHLTFGCPFVALDKDAEGVTPIPIKQVSTLTPWPLYVFVPCHPSSSPTIVVQSSLDL